VSEDTSEIRKLHLEIGGSVFELIEFGLSRRINGQMVKGLYGVNVAKVREVVRMPRLNPLASRIKGVPGIFELRGVPIPVVNLAVALGDDDVPVRSDQQIIVTEFSQKRAGFIVDSTHKIRRVAWDKVLPPSSDAMSCMSGMTLVENNEFLFILDLERVLLTLEYGEEYVRSLSNDAMMPQPRGDSVNLRPGHDLPESKSPQGPRILLVDDAAFIRNVVRQMLEEAGFSVTEARDGAEAFDLLEKSTHSSEKIDLIISDIEMPRLDGLGLTKKVRDHDQLGETPVILHTSLSGRANQSAGFLVGANGYVIKNDFQALFRLIHEILGSQVTHVKLG
jgi:two-component system chemotaxis response regulator CheV